MLSTDTKKRLRHVVLVGVVLALPLLYVGPVVLASVPFTIGALAFTAAVALLAMAAF